ncbi:MAG TPA: DUF4192 family protein, partial [Amnibacterium sp.]|nr:DUF4192 family protein [Amnibacterium sp.]
LGMLCRVEQVDGLIPVIYTGAPVAAVPGLLVDLLALHAHAAGLTVKDAFCVGENGWGHVPGGTLHPLAELGPDHPDLLDPAAELHIPEVPPEARARFGELLAAWRTRSGGPGGSVHGFRPADRGGASAFRRSGSFLLRAAAGLDTGPLLEGMLAAHVGEDPCPCLAALAAFAEVPDLAEHLLLHIAWGPAFGERVRRSWLERDEDDLLAEAALGGGEVERPSVERIEAGLRAVRAALAHLEPNDRAPLAVCAAWFEWALGRGSIAGGFVDLALAAEPGHPFGRLLAAELSRGKLPEWAFNAEPRMSLAEQLRRMA